MDQPRQGVVGLSHEDQLFLQRARKQLRPTFMVAWFIIGLSVFSGSIATVNFDRLFSALMAIPTPAIAKLHSENGRLQGLQTTTSLERELINVLIEKNRQLATLIHLEVVAGGWIIVGVVCGGLLTHGLTMLGFAKQLRRYLRIVEAMERTLHLSQG